MKVKLIVAMDPNGLIGLDGGLPWHYAEDLKRFKAQTMGGILVMGRHTYESLPKKTLPGRQIIVLSRTETYPAEHVAPGLLAAIQLAAQLDRHATVWVAGGAEVYFRALTSGLIEEVDLTLVPEEPEVTRPAVYFPIQRLEDDFQLVEETVNPVDPRLRHRLYRPKH